MRRVKSKAWVEEIETHSTPDGYGITLDCRTPEMKPFSITMRCNPDASEFSTRGRAQRLVCKMLDAVGVTGTEWAQAQYDAKTIAARVRHGFFWFLLDVNGQDIWLRDVKPCEPFEVFDKAQDERDAIAALEQIMEARDVS